MPTALGNTFTIILPICHAFAEEFPQLEKEFGWNIFQADAHPMRGCEANEADLLAAILEGKGFQSNPGGASDQFRTPVAPNDVFLMGYSKGAPDILSTLVHHHDKLDNKVKCVVTWAANPRPRTTPQISSGFPARAC